MGKLDGKVVLITGAARGQGAAQARLFVAEGATVVIGDVLDDVGQALVDDLGPQSRFQHLDVTDEDSWAAAVASIVAEFGRIDVLVNGAGINLTKLIEDTSVDEFMRLVRVNQLGPWLGMRAVIEPMRSAGGGAIVNVGSASVVAGLAGKSAYASTKHALRGMNQIAARELGRYGIRVNAVLPGGVATDMSPPDPNDRGFADQPVPRIGMPDEIARAVLFLASDDASYSTGAELLVDGGLTAAPLRAPLAVHDVTGASRSR